jgi:hypothetical protein
MHKSKAGRLILSIALAFSMVMVSLVVGVSPTVAASDAVLAGGDSIDVVNSMNVADKAKRAVSPLSDDDPIDVLEDMLDKARGVDRSLYTSASVGRLDAAILASQPIIDDPAGYTDDAIYAAAGALWNAYNELVYKANKAALEVVIEVAQGIDLNRLISSVRENLIVALAAAESAYADDNATQAQVDEAMEALIGAISEADFEKGSETRLRALVVSVQNTAAAGYTPASFAVFSAALANARAILDNAGDYTQRAFDEAYDALYAAHRGLVEATQTGPGPGTQNPGGKTTPGGVQPQAKVTAIRTPLKTLYIKKGKTLTPPVAFDGIGANGKAWGYGARSKLSWRVSSGKKVVSVNAKTGKI